MHAFPECTLPRARARLRVWRIRITGRGVRARFLFPGRRAIIWIGVESAGVVESYGNYVEF